MSITYSTQRQILTPFDYLPEFMRFACCTLWLLHHSVLINILVQVPSFICIKPFSSKLYRWVIDRTKVAWTEHLLWLVRLFGPSTFRLSTNGEILWGSRKRVIVISNHLSWVDWAYIWVLLAIVGDPIDLKYILKASPGRFPVLGWGMRFFRFVFLHRNWDADQKNLARSLKALKEDPFMLVFFPEGTVLSENTATKSNTYWKRTNSEPYEHHYTLLPRTKGLTFILQSISSPPIMDLTFMYSGTPAHLIPDLNSEKPFFISELRYGLRSVFCRGDYPANIAIDLEELDARPTEQDSQTSDAKVRSWLTERWRRKENLLEAYIGTGQMHPLNTSVSSSTSSVASSTPLQNRTPTSSPDPTNKHSRSPDVHHYVLPLCLTRYWSTIEGAPKPGSKEYEHLQKVFRLRWLVWSYFMALLYVAVLAGIILALVFLT